MLGLAGDVFRQEQPGVIALGLADALRQEEIEKRKKLAKFADRIARIRQADFELFQQIEQFHGLSLGSELGALPPRSPSVRRSEPQVRPITLRDSVGLTFTGKSEKSVADPAKRIVLASGNGNSWRSLSNLSTLSIDLAAGNRRKVRRRKGSIGGGGIEEVVELAVAAVLEELRVTEDDETRVTEDDEDRAVE